MCSFDPKVTYTLGYGFHVLTLQQEVNEHEHKNLICYLEQLSEVAVGVNLLDPLAVLLLKKLVRAQRDCIAALRQLWFIPGVASVSCCSQLTDSDVVYIQFCESCDVLPCLSRGCDGLEVK